jgi:hypothetical protein
MPQTSHFSTQNLSNAYRFVGHTVLPTTASVIQAWHNRGTRLDQISVKSADLKETLYRFGPFEFNPAERALRRSGILISVTPKALATLQSALVSLDL